jgi:hypothetical protein
MASLGLFGAWWSNGRERRRGEWSSAITHPSPRRSGVATSATPATVGPCRCCRSGYRRSLCEPLASLCIPAAPGPGNHSGCRCYAGPGGAVQVNPHAANVVMRHHQIRETAHVADRDDARRRSFSNTEGKRIRFKQWRRMRNCSGAGRLDLVERLMDDVCHVLSPRSGRSP